MLAGDEKINMLKSTLWTNKQKKKDLVYKMFNVNPG